VKHRVSGANRGRTRRSGTWEKVMENALVARPTYTRGIHHLSSRRGERESPITFKRIRPALASGRRLLYSFQGGLSKYLGGGGEGHLRRYVMTLIRAKRAMACVPKLRDIQREIPR